MILESEEPEELTIASFPDSAIYLPEGCALAGSENLFIFGEIWGSIGRLRLAVELVFEGLTFCFQCQCCRI